MEKVPRRTDGEEIRGQMYTGGPEQKVLLTSLLVFVPAENTCQVIKKKIEGKNKTDGGWEPERDDGQPRSGTLENITCQQWCHQDLPCLHPHESTSTREDPKSSPGGTAALLFATAEFSILLLLH